MSFSGQNFPLSVIVHKLLTFSSPTRSLAQFQWHLAQIIFQWRENEEPQILERNTENTWTFHLISSSRTTGPISIKQMRSHTLFQGDTPTTFRNLSHASKVFSYQGSYSPLKDTMKIYGILVCNLVQWPLDFKKEVGN